MVSFVGQNQRQPIHTKSWIVARDMKIVERKVDRSGNPLK